MGLIKYGESTDKDEMIPFYVTRPTGDGVVYKWSVGIQSGLIMLVLAQIVIILWLMIALIAGVIISVNAISDVVGGIL